MIMIFLPELFTVLTYLFFSHFMFSTLVCTYFVVYTWRVIEGQVPNHTHHSNSE